MRGSEAERRVGAYPAVVAFRDTRDEAAAVQRAALRGLGGDGRVALALRMTREAREIAASGLQRRHPELSREQARLQVIRRALGEALFVAAYGRRRE